MREIAVTGANGFLGWNLVAHLAQQGRAVRALVRPTRGRALPDRVTPVETGFDRASLAKALAGVDTVVHIAGITQARSQRVFAAVNVDITRQVATVARDLGVHFIQVSSQAAAGVGTLDRPTTEDDPPRPITPYGASKLAAEQVVQGMPGLGWTILRPCSVYGPRDRAFLPLYRLAARGLFPVVGAPETAYTLVHVDDVVLALAAAARVGPTAETFFIGHPEPSTADRLRAALVAALGRNVRTLRVPAPLALVAAGAGEIGRRLSLAVTLDVARWRELTAPGFVCNVEKARDVLGIEARTTLTTGTAETAAWYRQHRWLSPGA